MTNEQLAILLDGIQRELDLAIGDARTQLSIGRPTTTERRHQSPEMCFRIGCQNPEHFVMVEIADPVIELSALDDVSAELGYRISLLTAALATARGGTG